MQYNTNQKDITPVLADVANAVVGQFDMKVLLNKIINTTMDTLHAEVCSIFLEDKEKEPGILKCVAGSGFAERIIDVARYKLGEGFTGSVALTGQEYNIRTREELETLKINGKRIWEGLYDSEQWISGKSEFRNGIALPLKIKEQTFGVIKVENKINKYGESFSDDDFLIFKTIANVIALTIENARLVQKIEGQAKTLSGTLVEIATAVVGEFDVQVLLNKIIETTMNTLHAEVCSIFLEDKEKEPGVIRCVAGSGFAKSIVGVAEYKSGEGFTGTVFKYGEGYNSRGIEKHQDLKISGKKAWKGKYDKVQWPNCNGQFRNGIGLPLKIKDKTFGVIKVENKIEAYGKFFSDEDFIIFKTVANVIALTIENARLVQKIEGQSKTISRALAEIATAVVGQFDMNVLLDQIINTTMDTLHAEVCSIFLEDKEKDAGVLKCVAGSGFAKRIVNIARYKLGEGFTGSVALSGREYNIRTREELETLEINGKKIWEGRYDVEQWISGNSEFRNAIALPLKIKDQTLGVIKVENKRKVFGDCFTDEDLETFKTIANVIALAIENARLHDKTETQLKTISAKAAHRINNQASNYDGIELDLEEELKCNICDKDNLARINERLKVNTKNLKNMIGEFRSFAKPIVLQKTSCSINKIIKDEIWLAKPKGIKIDYSPYEKIPNFLIDEARFAESIKELLFNAMKALLNEHTENGMICISTNLINDGDQENVQILIQDNGPGILSNFPIFEPFYSTDPESTGLGLATVKELIEKHGGTISVDKSVLGGACFTILIPTII